VLDMLGYVVLDADYRIYSFVSRGLQSYFFIFSCGL